MHSNNLAGGNGRYRWRIAGLDHEAATHGSFAQSLQLLLTLPGGVLADHADQRRVIAGFQSLQMPCPMAIMVLRLAGIAHPWKIIAMSRVVGI